MFGTESFNRKGERGIIIICNFILPGKHNTEQVTNRLLPDIPKLVAYVFRQS